MGSPMTLSFLTLADLERSKLRSLGYQSLISRKRAELGPVLPLTINGKPYMASQMTPSHWTLSDLPLKGQSECHSGFKALYLVIKQSWALCYY